MDVTITTVDGTRLTFSVPTPERSVPSFDLLTPVMTRAAAEATLARLQFEVLSGFPHFPPKDDQATS